MTIQTHREIMVDCENTKEEKGVLSFWLNRAVHPNETPRAICTSLASKACINETSRAHVSQEQVKQLLRHLEERFHVAKKFLQLKAYRVLLKFV